VKIFRFVLSFIMCSMILNLFQIGVDAHNFNQNQDSRFFSLVKQFQIEKDLASDDVHINKSLALDHSENAAKLFKQITSFNNNITNNSKFVNKYEPMFGGLNSTTKALVAANLADESLKEYGRAKGLDPKLSTSLLNMTMTMATSMNSENNRTLGSEHASRALSLASDQVVRQSNFETSLSLAKSLKGLFLNYLKSAKLVSSTGLMQIPMEMKRNSIQDLGEGIDNLNSALNKNAPLEEVFSIVHGQIHPNLFLGFDLKLKGN